MFILSGSFGALATILFAIPGTPLAQPRVMLSAHALAIAVSVSPSAITRDRYLFFTRTAEEDIAIR